MPIYEFYSPDNHKIYSFYSRTIKNSDFFPLCPDGEKLEMRKMVSAFSVTGKGEGGDEVNDDSEVDPFSKLNDAQSSSVMKEMENAISGMDEENPDPRQMGSLMRKMCEMTGEKMDGVMEEVVRKLEEGANPEELEDSLGSAMEDADGNQDGIESSMDGALKKDKPSRYLTRDPKLYEFEDYLTPPKS